MDRLDNLMLHKYNQGYKAGVYEGLNQLFYLINSKELSKSEIMTVILDSKKASLSLDIEAKHVCYDWIDKVSGVI